MNTIVCTLFENNHHFGVAALINSLHKNEFKGAVYVGYRGKLPYWSSKAIPNEKLPWTGAESLEVEIGFTIHFIPVNTPYHLAHYKPDFMLDLMHKLGEEVQGIVYFDPDIVINNNWKFFNRWISYGVAMVHEIVSNDMPPTHPTRMEWKKVISKINRVTKRELHSYINCGFCGVARNNLEFLFVWSEIIAEAISNYNMDPRQFATFDRNSVFWSIDQDAFNIAAMCCNSPVSEMGPEAMDFIHAGWTMSHATGSPKPWNKKYLIAALDGRPPSKAEKEFWANTIGVIRIYNPIFVKLKKFSVLVASFIGRFYRRH